MNQYTTYVKENWRTPKGIAGFLIITILLASVLFASFSQIEKSTQPKKEQEKNQNNRSQLPQNISPHTIVYGTWTHDNSTINAIDLDEGKEYLLAQLPSNIKHVTALDEDRLLYVSETDTRDHGKKLSIYSISQEKVTQTIEAAENFGIDDYVVSPDKRYIATWEVQTDEESGVLFGGRSRVYTQDLQDPNTKNLITDENIDRPIHYPVAILNNGRVFMDKFLPNSGAGWAYGMSVSDFTGQNMQELENMQNGTYATPPELSPNGQSLVFAGYNEALDNSVQQESETRQALITPNTIELLDTQTMERRELNGLDNSNSYVSALWDKTDGNILYTQLASEIENSGAFSYDIQTQQSTPILLETSENSSNRLITQLSENKYIVGKLHDTVDHLGNLGETYSQTYSQLSVMNTESQTHTSLALSSKNIQFIDIQPAALYTNQQLKEQSTASNQQLHLEAFTIKPKIPSKRSRQQTSRKTTSSDSSGRSVITPEQPSQRLPEKDGVPHCRQHAIDRCHAKGYKSDAFASKLEQEEFKSCRKAVEKNARAADQCYGTPLYLYGKEGMKVNIKIHTPTYNSNIPSKNNGFDVTLSSNGKLLTNTGIYHSIDYSYTPALRRITPPTKGSIISQQELPQTITTYGKKLGLNEKEIEDLVNYAQANTSSPYVFISFFNHEISHAILPITFEPTPNTYRNIVFYFKELESHPGYNPELPQFEKIERHDFTAVEISGIVE